MPASIGPAARFGLVDLPLPGFAAAVAVERPHGPVIVLAGTAARAHEILTAARSAAYDSAVASIS